MFALRIYTLASCLGVINITLMEGEHIIRLPLNHPDRIKARDAKLQQRDEERARRNETSRYRCPCNLCGGRRRPYKSTTVARHLRHRGRHGALRGWTQVTNLSTQPLRFRLEKVHIILSGSASRALCACIHKLISFCDTG